MPKITTLAERQQQVKQIEEALEAISLERFTLKDLAAASGYSYQTICRYHWDLVEKAKKYPNYNGSWRQKQLPKILSREEKAVLAKAEEFYQNREEFTLLTVCYEAGIDYKAFLKNPHYSGCKHRIFSIAAKIRGINRAWRRRNHGQPGQT